MWTHLFSAAVGEMNHKYRNRVDSSYDMQMVVASIVTSAPSSNMAFKSYLELGTAVDLLVRGVNRTPRARGAMVNFCRSHSILIIDISLGNPRSITREGLSVLQAIPPRILYAFSQFNLRNNPTQQTR